MKTLLSFFCFLSVSLLSFAQDAQEQTSTPSTYILENIRIEGVEYSNRKQILELSGLSNGMSITLPGTQTADAMKRLWRTDLFGDIQIRQDSIIGEKAYLTMVLEERPRITQISFEGIPKKQTEDLREKISFIRGELLSQHKLTTAKRKIRNYYIEKGYYHVKVNIVAQKDRVLKRGVELAIKIDKGSKVRIGEIQIQQNEAFSDRTIQKNLKSIHSYTWWRFWQKSHFQPKKFDAAKQELISFYQHKGYRDAQIVLDTIQHIGEKELHILLKLDEGTKYVVRNIIWSGNYTYSSEILSKVLGISKGDMYSKQMLDQRLYGDPNGTDVSSLFLDQGHLFFRVDPIELLVEGDSIDLEMRMYEGPLTTIGAVDFIGNTKTSDDVIRRLVRTSPGQVFNRSDLIRSQRELINTNWFSPEELEVTPIPNEATGTVDLRYKLTEKPSDKIQLQGGWSPRTFDEDGNVISGGMTGTLMLDLNNFSTKRLFKPDSWRPVPGGDGQRLSLAYQTTGKRSKNFTLSFQEPWLGGKKSNFLGINMGYFSFQNLVSLDSSDNTGWFQNKSFSASVDFGTQLHIPDDYTRSLTSLGYRYYSLLNPGVYYPEFADESDAFINVVTLKQSFTRTSVDHPIFPTKGSISEFSIEVTPPYSLFQKDKDYSQMSSGKKYNLLEYHKWKFNSQWFWNVTGDWVVSAKVEGGYLGSYNKELGIPPFERFTLGGSGMMQLGAGGLMGLNQVSLRGYEAQALDNGGDYYSMYNKVSFEIRRPIPISEQMPLWILGFAEAGNGYTGFRDYNPLQMKRSAGVGFRAQLPMIGLIGLDWGYGFDTVPNTGLKSGGQLHLIFGREF